MHDKRHVNNKGMTLVELLLAVTILAVIVVPLLHAFVSSARINRKSKLNQKVTTLGQDVMEGLKAYSAKDLAFEFDYPGGCAEYPNGFQLIKPAMIDSAAGVSGNVLELRLKSGATNKYELCPDDDRAIKTKTEGGVTSHVFETAKGEDRDSNADIGGSRVGRARYYAITNVSAEISTDTSYKTDVLIKVNPVKFTGKSGGVSDNRVKHNDADLADLYSMDTTHDAFYLESGSQVMQALGELINDKGAPATTKASNLYKEIEILVENDPTGLYKQVSFKFKYHDVPGRVIEFPKTLLEVAKYSEIKNVYLFYIPSYGAADKDKITYTNNTDADINLYLVKRQTSPEDGMDYSYSSYDQLHNRDSMYSCDAYVKDLGTGKTYLRTNIDTDMSMYMVSSNDIRYDADKLLKPSPTTNVSFYDKNGPNSSMRHPLQGESKEDRLYDVTIDIYEAGAISEAIGPSGDGSIDPDKHLVTVRGDMN